MSSELDVLKDILDVLKDNRRLLKKILKVLKHGSTEGTVQPET